MIMINNSVESEHLGKVNGLGQSVAALARAVGPAIGGILWYEHFFPQIILSNTKVYTTTP